MCPQKFYTFGGLRIYGIGRIVWCIYVQILNKSFPASLLLAIIELKKSETTSVQCSKFYRSSSRLLCSLSYMHLHAKYTFYSTQCTTTNNVTSMLCTSQRRALALDVTSKKPNKNFPLKLLITVSTRFHFHGDDRRELRFISCCSFLAYCCQSKKEIR